MGCTRRSGTTDPAPRHASTRAGTPRPLRLLVLCGFALLNAPLAAQISVPQSVRELKKLSLEELMALEVTSVSGTEEPIQNAAAAVTIVTGEDIRRSGATSVPEALRLAPGIQVARQGTSNWAISARGFTSVNSEKLLVLSDTRSIYTPLFAGVLWDAQHYLLQDIDRIEIVRGPGATLWGANAMNGVINITTKHARDTQGFYAETATGTSEHATAAARYGGRIGGDAYYRVFGRYVDRDATFNPGAPSDDDAEAGHAGFRVDWDRSARDTLTLQGDFYRSTVGQLEPAVVVVGREGPAPPLRVRLAGGNVLGRWRRTLSPTADVQVRAYYDRTHRNDPAFEDDLHTVELDLRHRFAPIDDHELTWGANYRFMSNGNVGKGLFNLSPPDARDHLVSGFVQDQFVVAPRVHLTLGTKLERNDFSGVEVQPSGRAAWELSGAHTIWGAVSRAVRVPTRLERDVAIDASDPTVDPVLRLQGSPSFESERLIAFEAGHRWQPVAGFSTDLAVFHNRYDGLASIEPDDPFVDPQTGRLIVPVVAENLTSGHANGVEALVTYAPAATSRVTGTYTYLDLSLDPHGLDLNRGVLIEDSSPRHQVGLRAAFDLPARFQFDAAYRYVGEIRALALTPTGDGVPAYSELNLRLAWLGWRDAEISLVAHDLLHSEHREFGLRDTPSAIARGFYAKIAWGF